jgi:hypothetical protein
MIRAALSNGMMNRLIRTAGIPEASFQFEDEGEDDLSSLHRARKAAVRTARDLPAAR